MYLFCILLFTIFKQNKVFMKILLVYNDYDFIYFTNLIIKLLKNININKYAIELVKYKQVFYKPI